MKESTLIKKFLEWFHTLSGTQIAVGASATGLLVAGVIGGAVLADTLNTSNDSIGTEHTESTEMTESVFPQLPFFVEETEVTEETEMTEETAEISVKITTTSIDKDLKIKIVDDRGKLVKGFPFVVTVTPEGKEGSDYEDDDMDGMIHIKDLEGGKYKVLLQELEGILVEDNEITAKVKGYIEYQKVEIQNEIKNESQINVSIEDTASNNVVVEAPVMDTVALIESSVVTAVVPKENVDVSKLPAAVVSEEKNTYTLEQKKKEISGETPVPDSTQQPEVPQNPTIPEQGTQQPSTPSVPDTQQPSTPSVPETQQPETPVVPETQQPETQQPEAPVVPETQQPSVPESTPQPETPVMPESTPQPEAPVVPESTPQPEAPVVPESTPQPETPAALENPASIEEDVTEIPSEAPAGYSVSTAAATQTVTVAKADIAIPKAVTLYTVGSELSTTAEIILEVEDAQKIIESYAWKIENPDVADLAVAEDQKTAKLTAKAEGKTNIVISFTYKSDVYGKTNTYDLICELTVSGHTDKTTQLVDLEGNALYLDEKAEKIATPADLDKATQFYGNPKYTGWQSFDGYLYYYTQENVPVTGAQIIGGVNYEFHEDGRLKESQQSTGIDVSKWQANIDWKAVADAGIDFAIIRCAYRGASTGVIVEDPYFKRNIQGATQNGIKVGVYFFTQAITEAEAVEEASTAISLVSGYRLDFPIYIDTESAANGRANSLNKTDRTAIVKAFCETVRNAGYKPGVYASKYWYYDNLNASQLSTYNIWVAQYNTECNYTGRYDMWQYTSSGSVPGISGNVDMNICYTKY